MKEGSKKIELLEHNSLSFLSGEFSGASSNWTTYEKEAFAIFSTFSKLDFMLLDEHPIHVFTDHRNLLFVFSPTSFEPAVGRHVISKVQRWAIFLSQFNYVIEHIDGERNVFADILTRWARGYRNNSVYTSQVNSLVLEQLIPAASEIIWPDLEDMKSAQEEIRRKPHGVRKDNDGIYRRNGKIWVPDSNNQLKVIVSSHCGLGGHRGKKATESAIKESFWWPTLSEDVSIIIRGCLHCLVSRTGEMIPRPTIRGHFWSGPIEIVATQQCF